MRLFKVVANFLSLSISLSPRESELPPVILPANLRRPIPKRWNAKRFSSTADFLFLCLSLSLSFKKKGNKVHVLSFR